ncbi:LysR family transcriptional regulator [Enterococcus gilvus]|uniref:LysR family transcriptional regulator n=1 Tax=Enterococcus gilvus TaxID=160453 RepID=UPI003D6B8BD9
MNTFQLECFLAVAEYLNFTKAAEQMRLTQPAISNQIKTLEAELGVKLFFRTSRDVRLTKAGTQLIEEAKSILKSFGNIKHRLKETDDERVISLKIGCHNQLEVNLTALFLKKLLKEMPKVQPSIKYMPFKSMANLLEDESIQVMFGYKDTMKKSVPGKYLHLMSCPLVCVCSKEHPLAHRKALDPDQLTGRMILCEPHSIPQAVFKCQSDLASSRKDQDVIIGDGFESSLALSKAGVGFVIIPDNLLIRDPDLAYIPVNGFSVISFGVYYKTLKGNAALKTFIEVMKSESLSKTLI